MKKKMVEKARKSHWVSLRKNGATKARKRASIANCRGVRLRLLRRRQLNACLPVYRRNKRRPSTEQERTAAFLFPWNWWPLRDEKKLEAGANVTWIVLIGPIGDVRWSQVNRFSLMERDQTGSANHLQRRILRKPKTANFIAFHKISAIVYNVTAWSVPVTRPGPP